MTNLRTHTDSWTHESVAKHFEEAIATLRRLPSVKLRAYLSAWPEIIHTPKELMRQEAVPMRLRAAPDAITRLEQTFGWMTWLDVEERKLIWRRAAKVRWRAICWEFGCDRSTAWRKWVLACNKVAARLNAQDFF